MLKLGKLFNPKSRDCKLRKRLKERETQYSKTNTVSDLRSRYYDTDAVSSFRDTKATGFSSPLSVDASVFTDASAAVQIPEKSPVEKEGKEREGKRNDEIKYSEEPSVKKETPDAVNKVEVSEGHIYTLDTCDQVDQITPRKLTEMISSSIKEAMETIVKQCSMIQENEKVFLKEYQKKSKEQSNELVPCKTDRSPMKQEQYYRPKSVESHRVEDKSIYREYDDTQRFYVKKLRDRKSIADDCAIKEKVNTEKKTQKHSKLSNNVKTDNRRMTGNVNIYICSEANENTKANKKQKDSPHPRAEASSATTVHGSNTRASSSISSSRLASSILEKRRKKSEELNFPREKSETFGAEKRDRERENASLPSERRVDDASFTSAKSSETLIEESKLHPDELNDRRRTTYDDASRRPQKKIYPAKTEETVSGQTTGSTCKDANHDGYVPIKSYESERKYAEECERIYKRDKPEVLKDVCSRGRGKECEKMEGIILNGFQRDELRRRPSTCSCIAEERESEAEIGGGVERKSADARNGTELPAESKEPTRKRIDELFGMPEVSPRSKTRRVDLEYVKIPAGKLTVCGGLISEVRESPGRLTICDSYTGGLKDTSGEMAVCNLTGDSMGNLITRSSLEALDGSREKIQVETVREGRVERAADSLRNGNETSRNVTCKADNESGSESMDKLMVRDYSLKDEEESPAQITVCKTLLIDKRESLEDVTMGQSLARDETERSEVIKCRACKSSLKDREKSSGDCLTEITVCRQILDSSRESTKTDSFDDKRKGLLINGKREGRNVKVEEKGDETGEEYDKEMKFKEEEMEVSKSKGQIRKPTTLKKIPRALKISLKSQSKSVSPVKFDAPKLVRPVSADTSSASDEFAKNSIAKQGKMRFVTTSKKPTGVPSREGAKGLPESVQARKDRDFVEQIDEKVEIEKSVQETGKASDEKTKKSFLNRPFRKIFAIMKQNKVDKMEKVTEVDKQTKEVAREEAEKGELTVRRGKRTNSENGKKVKEGNNDTAFEEKVDNVKNAEQKIEDLKTVKHGIKDITTSMSNGTTSKTDGDKRNIHKTATVNDDQNVNKKLNRTKPKLLTAIVKKRNLAENQQKEQPRHTTGNIIKGSVPSKNSTKNMKYVSNNDTEVRTAKSYERLNDANEQEKNETHFSKEGKPTEGLEESKIVGKTVLNLRETTDEVSRSGKTEEESEEKSVPKEKAKGNLKKDAACEVHCSRKRRKRCRKLNDFKKATCTAATRSKERELGREKELQSCRCGATELNCRALTHFEYCDRNKSRLQNNENDRVCCHFTMSPTANESVKRRRHRCNSSSIEFRSSKNNQTVRKEECKHRKVYVENYIPSESFRRGAPPYWHDYKKHVEHESKRCDWNSHAIATPCFCKSKYKSDSKKPMICLYCDNPRGKCVCQIADCESRKMRDDGNSRHFYAVDDRMHDISRKAENGVEYYLGKDSACCHCHEKSKPRGSNELPYQRLTVFSNVMNELQQKISESVCCTFCREVRCRCTAEKEGNEVTKEKEERPQAKCYYCKSSPCFCITAREHNKPRPCRCGDSPLRIEEKEIVPREKMSVASENNEELTCAG